MTKELDKLTESIISAEKYISKLPGAHLESCYITYKDSMLYLSEHKQIVVEFNDEDPIRILELPVLKRVDYASQIPNLITLAKTGEGKIRELAIEGAELIEQCIAKITQEFEDSYNVNS
jgi:hypothetical protein